MKRRLGASGYTVLEVMIVLAVSGTLMVSALALISGQRQKTEFQQALKDVEGQINDVINDVSTGYYSNTGNFTCVKDVGSGRPRLQSSASDTQGSNNDCIFIGRVMQFAENGSSGEKYNIFNVVGLRQALNGGTLTNSQTIAQTVPTAMAPGTSGVTSNYPSSTENKRLQYGLSLRSIRVGAQSYGAVGFFGSLVPINSTGGNLLSGAQTVQLIPIPNTALDATAPATVDRINALDTASLNVNPTSGVVLCFQSGGTNQYGLITIGSNARRLSTTTSIQSGVCP